MRIVVKKKKHPAPIVLANGDAYDGIATVYDNNGKTLGEFHINTDPTNTYKGGELASGEYIYKKHIRPNGRIVYNIYTKKGESVLPSVKPNPNHKGKPIITGVQIHCGGKDWDGSHGCLTIPPIEWLTFIQVAGESGTLQVLENVKHLNTQEANEEEAGKKEEEDEKHA